MRQWRDLMSINIPMSVSELAAEVAPSFNLFLNSVEDGQDWNASHIQAVGYDDADDHVRSLTDAAHTAKDLRTRNATVVAAVAFAEHGWAGGAGLSATALERAEAATTCRVARALGDTPAVARSSYVDPCVVRAFEEGHTVAAGLRCIPRGAGEHRTRVAVGRAVLRLLERHN